MSSTFKVILAGPDHNTLQALYTALSERIKNEKKMFLVDQRNQEGNPYLMMDDIVICYSPKGLTATHEAIHGKSDYKIYLDLSDAVKLNTMDLILMTDEPEVKENKLAKMNEIRHFIVPTMRKADIIIQADYDNKRAIKLGGNTLTNLVRTIMIKAIHT